MKITKNQSILWQELLDLGVSAYLARVRKQKSKQKALEGLKESFFRQSEEHWQGLYSAFKKLK